MVHAFASLSYIHVYLDVVIFQSATLNDHVEHLNVIVKLNVKQQLRLKVEIYLFA